MRGFEPPTPCAQGRCATRLRYTPSCVLFAAIAGPACVTEHKQQSNATAARWVQRAQDFSTAGIAIPPGCKNSEFCRALPAHLVLARGKDSIAMRETRGRFFQVVAFHGSTFHGSACLEVRSDHGWKTTVAGCHCFHAAHRELASPRRSLPACLAPCSDESPARWPPAPEWALHSANESGVSPQRKARSFGQSFAAARARCEYWFFSSRLNSANVFPVGGWKNTGS